MVAEHGPGSGQVHAMELDRHDAYLWQALLRRLHDDLDALYRSADLSPEERLSRKAARFAALDEDVACAGFFFTERFLRMAREERWNNARVAQARTYDSNRALLDALLARHGGDLMSFTEELTSIAERPDGLWDAVRTAAGSPAPDPKADLPSSATGALPID
jgi:predicted aminopeptidase